MKNTTRITVALICAYLGLNAFMVIMLQRHDANTVVSVCWFIIVNCMVTFFACMVTSMEMGGN